MTTIISALMLICSLAASADVGGTWKGTATTPLPEGNPRVNQVVLFLTQDGETIRGSVGQRDDDLRQIAKGRIVADRIDFEVSTGDSVFKVTATVAGEMMSGLVIGEQDGYALRVKLELKRESGNFSGIWSGTLTPEGSGEGPLHFVFKHEGRALTGTGGPSPGEQNPIEDGVADANQLSFEVPTPKGILRFNLTADGDRLSGKATRQSDAGLNSATVSAKRTKN